jgi:7-cyano-7-deazaguanine reductase
MSARRQPLRSARPGAGLETFPNPNPERDYEIAFDCPEFTCLCPRTGQPDFATIRIRYVPGRLCVELKSLKLYLWSWRDQGAFHEAVTNRICDDLATAMDPRRLTVTGDFWVRGGIHTVVTVEHRPGQGKRAPRAGQARAARSMASR